jgi:predicted dehydrogenase
MIKSYLSKPEPSGIEVICDKPLCLALTEAKALKRVPEERGLILCLAHKLGVSPVSWTNSYWLI